MRLLIAILAVLALAGSTMAWDITDEIQYTYTKTVYQQAGDDFVLPALDGTTSKALYYQPAAVVDVDKDNVLDPEFGPWASGARLVNTLGTLEVDRDVYYPDTNLDGADFAAVLSQGGSATTSMHSMASDPILAGVPEMQGEANAWQNLNVMGGFDQATATFRSVAAVGLDGGYTVTRTTPEDNSVMIDSEQHGGGVIEQANLGVKVESDIIKDYPGSGWSNEMYSGGLTLWGNFVACDPGCGNPIDIVITGTSETQFNDGWTGAGGEDNDWDLYWQSASNGVGGGW